MLFGDILFLGLFPIEILIIPSGMKTFISGTNDLIKQMCQNKSKECWRYCIMGIFVPFPNGKFTQPCPLTWPVPSSPPAHAQEPPAWQPTPRRPLGSGPAGSLWSRKKPIVTEQCSWTTIAHYLNFGTVPPIQCSTVTPVRVGQFIGGRRTMRGTPGREPHIPYQIPNMPYQIWNSMSF